ncbi:MAG TPA: helix-turn-helix transcriptional regulator [Acidimicrobiales bacterium]|nr:helix-turn-helix transcriptional regulator [Acidimicrobiales bacterium]
MSERSIPAPRHEWVDRAPAAAGGSAARHGLRTGSTCVGAAGTGRVPAAVGAAPTELRALVADRVRALILADDLDQAAAVVSALASRPRDRDRDLDRCCDAETTVRSLPTRPTTFGHVWTRRELEILELLPTHLSYAEIGRRLHISVNTVKSNLKVVYRVLGAGSRSEALTQARAAGLLAAGCAGCPEGWAVRLTG